MLSKETLQEAQQGLEEFSLPRVGKLFSSDGNDGGGEDADLDGEPKTDQGEANSKKVGPELNDKQVEAECLDRRPSPLSVTPAPKKNVLGLAGLNIATEKHDNSSSEEGSNKPKDRQDA